MAVEQHWKVAVATSDSMTRYLTERILNEQFYWGNIGCKYWWGLWELKGCNGLLVNYIGHSSKPGNLVYLRKKNLHFCDEIEVGE